MQTFEDLLTQGKVNYSVSGHYLDSGMDFQDLLHYYRGRNLREEPNIRFMRQREGSKFFLDDLIEVHVYAPPTAERVQQAQQSGINVKSHIEIHTGKEYFRKGGVNAAIDELKVLLNHHVDNKIPATLYIPQQREFQGINKP